MKIISWNLLHFAGATLDEIVHLIEDEHPDLLLMQEATRRIDSLPARLGGYYARHPLPGRRHGLAAWSPTPFRTAPQSIKLQSGLMVPRICQILGLSGLTVANVHLSHGQILNRRQLGLIFDSLPVRAAVLGDCNMVGPVLQNRFRDVGPRIATHFAGAVLPLRLDRCFVRNLDCTEVGVLSKGGSDHRPIMVRLRIPQSNRSDGLSA
ncbi:endonuclease/exonuclease/phosphatase family protein [Telmatospirillum siberiense]|uniref:Endonuclease n=1 Tax=Telmatospirillum siberiense TaxID=382514 RepID=A0A2N3PRK0_9PROT|nr:endonuclease/exonuclease/phosphatase family protein [Telmatospirillum siberiense]PKU23025.1 endonuclease [Telmatospirillum siberiense]